MADTEVLRKIPSVEKILNSPELKGFAEKFDRSHLTTIIRKRVDEFRERQQAGEELALEYLSQGIVDELNELSQSYFCYAINALGIILHTGLGRAPFSDSIKAAVDSVTRGYSRLEIDDEGKRLDRYKKISSLLQILTGAEAGLIVNNNAAATLLILNTIAKDKEVIVSRGQLIEIGGSFRMPEIMAQSGAILREVGTTNRTYLKDYKTAINERTAAILRVHQSNYRILGFTKEVDLVELVELGKKYNLPVIDDLGSGTLIDFSKYGLAKEPLVQESIRSGADIVCFSGDKLLGGPQCGIIIGKKSYLEKIKENPLYRALRCDKLTNAVLESTLQLFLRKEEDIIRQHAVFRLMLKPINEIKRQAKKCAKALAKLSSKVEVRVRPSVSEIGGGSLSTEQLSTYVLAIRPKKGHVEKLARRLRRYRIPIFGRIEEDQLLLDFRTVFRGEERVIAQALQEILSEEPIYE